MLKHVGTAVSGPNRSLYSVCLSCSRGRCTAEGGILAFVRERTMHCNYQIFFLAAASSFFLFSFFFCAAAFL